MSAPILSEHHRQALARTAVRTIPSRKAASPLLLICEHAGNEVPAAWRELGLAAAFLDTHFALDIGAAALTKLLAEELGAAVVLATYSRLFLDLNRFPGDWDCLRPDLGGIPVPGNLGADDDDRALREEIARAPFDDAVERLLVRRPAVISIHSFTPVMAGVRRRTEIGVLWRKEGHLGEPVLEALRRQERFVIGSNEPYDWHLADGYTLARHGLDRGLPCLYLEIRNDLMATHEGLKLIVDALAPALEEAVRDVAESWTTAVE
jgi:predicted N-formylglutamate amidohydrolase